MFFETVPPEAQAPLQALRHLTTSASQKQTSTLTMDGEVVRVETSNLGSPSFDFE
jgi:hypothetical protein